MKAVIFNSGLGKRMGALTEDKHKSMVRLQNDEAIFERQLRLLHECGITEFVVTVGPFKEQLIEASQAPHLRGCRFTFVENPIYDKTNYIYSMYLSREYLTGDLLLLHGDLVFNKRLAWEILHSDIPSLGCVNRDKPLPEKDFKARVVDGRIHEVSIHISALLQTERRHGRRMGRAGGTLHRGGGRPMLRRERFQRNSPAA